MDPLEEMYQTSQNPATMDTAQLDQMILQANHAWQEYEKAKETADELRSLYDQAEAKVIETLNAIGKKKYFVDGLGTFSVRTKFSYTTPKDNLTKRQLVDYIAEQYGEDTAFGMLSVNSNTLNAWANKENEAKPGVAIPGLASPTSRDSLVFPRAGEIAKQGAGK